MRVRVVLLLLAALVLGGCGKSQPGPQPEPDRSGTAGKTRASVTRVVDGDTILVSIGGRSEYVRYIGIDTPETVKPGTPVQCFGPQAHDANERLVGGRQVRLVFDRELRDRYDRLLAYVFTGHRFVNAYLVRRGFARPLTISPNTRYAVLFNRLAQAAGRRGRGLWGACTG